MRVHVTDVVTGLAVPLAAEATVVFRHAETIGVIFDVYGYAGNRLEAEVTTGTFIHVLLEIRMQGEVIGQSVFTIMGENATRARMLAANQ